MVQMSDEKWTMEAMHFASALARSINGEIVLLHLMLANNPGLLGWAINPPSARERRQTKEYAAVAEDYGIEFCVQPMQYISLDAALAQAADRFNVSILFAHIAQRNVPYWRRFRLWNLKRHLGDCRLYTLDEKQPLSIEEPILTTASRIKTTAT
jgi:hypothetical protein